MATIFGIDIGTINSVVTITNKETGIIEPVPNIDGNYTTPSVIYLNGNIKEIGAQAYEYTVTMPQNTCTEFKRTLAENVPAKVIAGVEYSPEQLTSFLIKHMYDSAINYAKEKPDMVVLTYPAHASEKFKEAYKKAAHLAITDSGVSIRFREEPVAAALCSGRNGNSTRLVIDIGGGTADVTVMQAENGVIDCLYIDGDSRLGGMDFNSAMEEDIKKRYLSGIPIESYPADYAELKAKIEQVKKILSRREATCFSVGTPNGRVQITYTRNEFEQASRDVLNRIEEVIKRTKEYISESEINIDAIDLIGGSTQVKSVQEIVHNYFGEAAQIIISDPALAVAKGASAYGVMLLNGIGIEVNINVGFTELNSIAAKSLGIHIKKKNDDGYEVKNLIKLGEKLPVKMRFGVFETSIPNQQSVSLKVYESYSDDLKVEISEPSLKCVGEARLSLKGNLPLGSDIYIGLSFDADGIVKLEAYEETGQTKIDAEFHVDNMIAKERD